MVAAATTPSLITSFFGKALSKPSIRIALRQSTKVVSKQLFLEVFECIILTCLQVTIYNLQPLLHVFVFLSILAIQCYTLSCILRLAESSDCVLGSGTLASSVIPFIRSICHHVYSVYSSIPKFCFPMCFMFLNLFHVSVLLHIFTPLFYFCSLNPDPDICLILITVMT